MWPFNRRAQREKALERETDEANRIANREHNLWKHVLQIQAADDSIEPADHQLRNQLTITKVPKDWNPDDYDTSRHLRKASALCVRAAVAYKSKTDCVSHVALHYTCALCEQDSSSSVLSVVMNDTYRQQQAIKRIDSSLEAIFRERTENEKLAEQAAKETLEALRNVNKCRGAPREDSISKKAVLSDKLQYRESDVNRCDYAAAAAAALL
jgi:hypothetical protein